MARRINPFEEDSLPPFDGFPKGALHFLRELKKNNDRDWFNENRKRYEQNVREPMQMLLASLAARMKGVHPDIVVDPKKSMYRIH
ncbi:MAG: DUF2461 family protein, partial [Bacteroidetes bacterium]|nr:DUF2461 family protein [Bacteroidota bacterium]